MRYANKILFIAILVISINRVSGQRLIAHYTFDKTAVDISGNGNHGTAYGGVSSTSDRFGYPCGALRFNGVDGYIEVPSSPSLNAPTNQFSVTTWFKIEYTPLHSNLKWLTFVCKGLGTTETYNNPHYRLQTFQSSHQSTISINTDFTEYDNSFASHGFQYDVWAFYALVYDGNSVKTFLNGEKIWEFYYSKDLSPNNYPLFIGRDDPGAIEYFCGVLDDLRIFGGSLSDDQVNKIFKDNSFANQEEVSISCPDNISTTTGNDGCFATVYYSQPIMDIKCGTAVLSQIGGLKSGEKFPLGESKVTFEAKGSSGLSKICSSIITVADKIPPVIICNKDTVLKITDINAKSVKYNYLPPGATDNCKLMDVKLVSGLASGSQFSIGTNTLTFVATDKSGNRAECSYNVIVTKEVTQAKETDIQPTDDSPFSCPNDISVTNESKKCGAKVHFSFSNNNNSKEIKLLNGAESGNFFKVGTTTNEYSKGTQKCKFNITVIDNEKPVILCPNDTIIYLAKGKNNALCNYSEPIATDNCGIKKTSQISGLKTGSYFPKGQTENLFKTEDEKGNVAMCSFKVFVVDTSSADIVQEVKKAPDIRPDIKDSISYNHTLSFDNCSVTFVIYDNAKQDNDTVSVYFNGQLIVDRQMILLKHRGTIDRVLKLNPDGENLLVVKAWNNGEISPNTLKIDFYKGDHLFEIEKMKKTRPDDYKIIDSSPGYATAVVLNCK